MPRSCKNSHTCVRVHELRRILVLQKHWLYNRQAHEVCTPVHVVKPRICNRRRLGSTRELSSQTWMRSRRVRTHMLRRWRRGAGRQSK